MRLDDPQFWPPGDKPVELLLSEHPNAPPKPAAVLGVHSSSNGLDFASPTFGYEGQAFIAQFGDQAPTVGKVLAPVGFKIVRVDVATGAVHDFAVNAGKVSAAALGALTLVACGSARRGELFATTVVPTSTQSERGEKVFFEHCHKCHTRGEAALGPALNNKPLPGFMIRLQVRRGLGAMPAFPADQISDDQLDDLVLYLKELRRIS